MSRTSKASRLDGHYQLNICMRTSSPRPGGSNTGQVVYLSGQMTETDPGTCTFCLRRDGQLITVFANDDFRMYIIYIVAGASCQFHSREREQLNDFEQFRYVIAMCRMHCKMNNKMISTTRSGALSTGFIFSQSSSDLFTLCVSIVLERVPRRPSYHNKNLVPDSTDTFQFHYLV